MFLIARCPRFDLDSILRVEFNTLVAIATSPIRTAWSSILIGSTTPAFWSNRSTTS